MANDGWQMVDKWLINDASWLLMVIRWGEFQRKWCGSPVVTCSGVSPMHRWRWGRPTFKLNAATAPIKWDFTSNLFEKIIVKYDRLGRPAIVNSLGPQQLYASNSTTTTCLSRGLKFTSRLISLTDENVGPSFTHPKTAREKITILKHITHHLPTIDTSILPPKPGFPGCSLAQSSFSWWVAWRLRFGRW